MDVPLEYLLYLTTINKNRNRVTVQELVNILHRLKSEYRINILNVNELMELLEILQDVDVIKLEKENKTIWVVIKDPDYIKNRYRLLVSSYLYRIDQNYREVLESVRKVVDNLIS